MNRPREFRRLFSRDSDRHGLRFSSVLNNPITDSARALSSEPPTVPTDGCRQPESMLRLPTQAARTGLVLRRKDDLIDYVNDAVGGQDVGLNHGCRIVEHHRAHVN